MSPILDSTQAAADTLSQQRAISSKASDRILLQADDERRFLVVVLNPEDKRHELVAYYAEKTDDGFGQVVVSSAEDGYKVDAAIFHVMEHEKHLNFQFSSLRSMLGPWTYEILGHAIEHMDRNYQHPHFIGLVNDSPVYLHQLGGMQKFQWVGGELSQYLEQEFRRHPMPRSTVLFGMRDAVRRLRQP